MKQRKEKRKRGRKGRRERGREGEREGGRKEIKISGHFFNPNS